MHCFGHKIIHLLLMFNHQHLLIFFRSQTSVGVRNLDAELLRTLDDLLALLAANSVTNLGRIGSVLHEQHFEVLNR